MVTMVDHGNFSVENPQITILIFFAKVVLRSFGEKVLERSRRFRHPFEGS